MTVSELLLKINLLVEDALYGIGVHVDGNGSIMDGERIGRFNLCRSVNLVLLCHVFEVARV
jgi:hypothetical protein